MQKKIPPSRIKAIKTFGNSMAPILHDEDIVYLKHKNFQQIRINDIVCVKKNSKIFTHRVIYRTKKYLITKGDNNFIADNKIYSKNIIGIVNKVKRKRQVFGIQDLYLLQSTFYFQEIVKVKKAFERAKINFVFLKGLPLHLYYEGVHPKRIYADCDVLISEKHSSRAEEILGKFGYKRVDASLSSIQKKIKNKESEASFYKISSGFPVMFDIHFEIVFMMTQLGQLDPIYPQKLIDSLSEKVLEEKRIIKVNDSDFPILSSSNLFIYLLLHLFHHNFNGAHRFDFIQTLTDKEKFNYKEAARVINEYKLNNFVYPALLLLEKYYNLSLSKPFLKQIEPNKNSLNFIHRKIVKTGIFSEEGRISQGVERFKNLFYLSPVPFYKRVFVLLNPQVIFAVLWTLRRTNASKMLI